MLTEKVKKLKPETRFWYWIRERQKIYEAKAKGMPKPWTNDEILNQYFFTNPFRENDKVTIWFREHIREPLRDDPRVLMATVIFRWFNLPYTGEQLMMYPGKGDWGALDDWNQKAVTSRLCGLRDHGAKVFTGAFMINSPPGRGKVEAICEMISNVWKRRDWLLKKVEDSTTMQEAHSYLTTFERLGNFMAYEVVCDLRYTYLLENSSDLMTWTNPGPGAMRGLLRITGKEAPEKNTGGMPRVPNAIEIMQELLAEAPNRFKLGHKFELREIEHSLCEWDKYERVLAGGSLKRRYTKS